MVFLKLALTRLICFRARGTAGGNCRVSPKSCGASSDYWPESTTLSVAAATCPDAPASCVLRVLPGLDNNLSVAGEFGHFRAERLQDFARNPLSIGRWRAPACGASSEFCPESTTRVRAPPHGAPSEFARLMLCLCLCLCIV